MDPTIMQSQHLAQQLNYARPATVREAASHFMAAGRRMASAEEHAGFRGELIAMLERASEAAQGESGEWTLEQWRDARRYLYEEINELAKRIGAAIPSAERAAAQHNDYAEKLAAALEPKPRRPVGERLARAVIAGYSAWQASR